MLRSGTYRHEALGEFTLRTVAGSRRFSARVSRGIIRVSCAPETSARALEDWLGQVAPQLIAMRDKQNVKSALAPGMVFRCMCTDVVLAENTLKPDHVSGRLTTDGRTYTIYIGKNVDVSKKAELDLVADFFRRIARYRFGELADEARAEAQRLTGRIPKIEMAHGAKTLGTCYSRDNRITFSWRATFLPAELRRHLIHHELAHFTHADHSAAFHALLNTYANGGGAALTEALRHYRFPF